MKLKCYTGIGSRNITLKERRTILNIATFLHDNNYTVYSGNAKGSDITFQTGSKGNCLVSLPWNGFNKHLYDYERDALDYFYIPDVHNGIEFKDCLDSIKAFHPKPDRLKKAGILMMMRNYYQVFGFGNYPRSSFVIFCADENSKGDVSGGTGQAVRIAKSLNLPCINIRKCGWLKEIKKIIGYENDKRT